MTNYREILKLHNLGISNAQVAVGCSCSRTTVVSTLKKAKEQSLTWPQAAGMSNEEIATALFPLRSDRPIYRMPDYEYVYKELQRDGVTLNLLWLEYCDQCQTVDNWPTKAPSLTNSTEIMFIRQSSRCTLNTSPERRWKWIGPAILRESSTQILGNP